MRGMAEQAGTRFFFLALIALSACSGVKRTLREPTGPLTVSAVVVYPVRLTGGDAPGWRAFELGQRLVETGLRERGDELAFFGPSEFQVTRWEDEGAWVATNVLPLLTRSGNPPDQAVVLRATAERRVASQVKETQDAKGRARGNAVTEETTWVCTVELLHPSTRVVLAELSAEVTVDPFAAPTGEEEFDPAAPMTHLLERLAKDALSVAAKYRVERAAVKEAGLTLALTPAVTTVQPDTNLATMDALAGEIWVQNRARFLAPWLSDEQAAKAARMQPGLWVVGAASTDASSRVEAGDLITRVDGDAPLPQVLARKRLAGVPVQVTVRRNGNETEALVP